MKIRPKTEKLPKGVDQSFVDIVQSMSTDELKSQIVTLQLHFRENEEFKKSEGYVEAKDRYQEVVGPIKETSISLRNKTKLVVERLKEKGGG